MIDSTPEDRFGHLFELIGDAVVEIELVDETPIVRSVNRGFEDAFGYDRDEVLGESLNRFIIPDGDGGRATRFDERTAAGKPNTALVTRETATGPREFLYRGVPYQRDGAQFGFAIYTDITDERRYERHLEVVHRLFRHDLRNDLQVILGTAARIETRATDPEIERLAATLVDRAEQIAEVGADARIIEQTLLDDREPTPVDVGHLCRRVVAERERTEPSTRVDVEATEDVVALGVENLRAAIAALVDNAVEHGGDSVVVSAGETDDAVVVAVADDGPGIPAEFRAPVFENSDITDLQHSRGLGLWLVRWVVELSGGQLHYYRRDGVTTIEIELTPATVRTRPGIAE
jgi:PAS domain S-box-containing protein